MCFSFFMIFSFLAIFHVVQCLCLVFHVFQFSLHNSGHTMCIFHFSSSSVFLSIFLVLQYVFLILHIFSVFSPYPGSTVCVSHFPWLSVILPYSRSYIVHLTFSIIFSFLAIFQVILCAFLIFQHFQGFTLYSMSYSVSFLFFTFFSLSRDNFLSYSVCFSFSMIFSFLTIHRVLQCAFLFFHIFQGFSPYFSS